MARRFINDRRDATHKPIVEHLEANGIEVIQTMRPLDCLIFNAKRRAGWIEIKTTKRNAAIMLTQVKFMADTKMPVAFVSTKEEALEFARTLKGITQKQKDDLRTFYLTCTRKQVHPAVIERVLAWE